MKLRKCPKCKETVGAESYCCPRCGVNFRSAAFRRFMFWLIILGAAGWATAHYYFKLI